MVWTPLKSISQLEWWFPIYGKKNQTTSQITSSYSIVVFVLDSTGWHFFLSKNFSKSWGFPLRFYAFIFFDGILVWLKLSIPAVCNDQNPLGVWLSHVITVIERRLVALSHWLSLLDGFGVYQGIAKAIDDGNPVLNLSTPPWAQPILKVHKTVTPTIE